MKKVALFTHQACLAHEPGGGHAECPERLRAVLAALEHPDFVSLLRESAPEATPEQLALAHPRAYVEAILALRPTPDETIMLDPDTFVSEGSVGAARHAAGAAIAAVDAVMDGLGGRRLRRGASPRPPRRSLAGHGLLPVRLGRHRRPARPHEMGRETHRHCRFRRPSRQRHAAPAAERSGHALPEQPPDALLPRHRRAQRNRHRPQRRQHAARPRRRKHRVPPCLGVYRHPGTRNLQTRAPADLRRVSTRTAPTRWPSSGSTPTISAGSPTGFLRSPMPLPRAASCPCWRVGTI